MCVLCDLAVCNSSARKGDLAASLDVKSRKNTVAANDKLSTGVQGDRTFHDVGLAAAQLQGQLSGFHTDLRHGAVRKIGFKGMFAAKDIKGESGTGRDDLGKRRRKFIIPLRITDRFPEIAVIGKAAILDIGVFLVVGGHFHKAFIAVLCGGGRLKIQVAAGYGSRQQCLHAVGILFLHTGAKHAVALEVYRSVAGIVIANAGRAEIGFLSRTLLDKRFDHSAAGNI